MKQLFFYVLFGFFSASLNATDKVETAFHQTFSKAHTESVTESVSVRLKEIDVANPIFILR